MLAGQDSRRPDFRLYLSMLYCLFCLLPHCIVNSCYPIWGWRLQRLQEATGSDMATTVNYHSSGSL